jgi:predicted nucleotidyltransferase
MARKKPAVSTDIRRMVRRIVQGFNPEKVILFGSRARGDGGPDSDVDLLVVMEVPGSKREKAVEIGVALHDVDLAKDVIVVRPGEYAWRRKMIGTIERPADTEGKVLYERR